MARSMRSEHVEGGDADQDEEVMSEERDATEPGESSHERARGGHMPAAHMARKMQRGFTEKDEPERPGHERREPHEYGPHGVENFEAEEKHDRESAPQEERRRGGRMAARKRGGLVPEHEKKREEEEKKRHKRARGGKVPGKAAKHHPGRRARGGATADLAPNTAAGKMMEPAYMKDTEGKSEGGKGPDRD
jgi:hypothetical protein